MPILIGIITAPVRHWRRYGENCLQMHLTAMDYRQFASNRGLPVMTGRFQSAMMLIGQ